MSACSPQCGCASTAAAAPVARVNGVPLHAR